MGEDAPNKQNEEALKKRIEEALPIATRLVHKLVPRLAPHIDRQDLVAAAHLAVVRAAYRFDPDRGAAWLTFAYHHVRGAVLDELERQRRQSPAAPSPPPPPTPYELATKTEDADRVRSALEHLPKRTRRIITLYYVLDLPMREIGNALNLSESRVSQILANARAQLRERLI